MAAKPPKPPGNFLKSLLNQNNKLQKHQNNEEQETQQCNSEICHTSTTNNCNTIPFTTTTTTTKKPDCNCSNISIMHLFHEMKQEFPTIPDTVVAQCVNENCHQRENCIQMLRNELELNPIPVQSYPAKILHPSTTNNNNCAASTPTSSQKPPLQQKPQLVQQKPPLKPLRPTRAAPLQPSTPTQNSPQLQKPPYSSGNITTTTTTPHSNKLQGGGVGRGGSNVSVCDGGEFNDMPSLNSPQHIQTQQKSPPPLTVNSTNEVNNNENAVVCSGGESIMERNIPKQRPTTLNLNTHQQNQNQQQQQRQRLNIQLQQHFQEQRNKQHQQPPHTTKPTRKAPLPPIAPKPSQLQFNSTANSVVSNTTNNNNHFNDTLSSTHTSPESEISVSVSLSTPSPTSSLHHHNTTQHSTPIQQHQQQLQTKSPIRHRSVITLQPEPPYTRDFASANSNALVTSTSANSSPTTSLSGSQKSFTSVNLTLRPPVTPTGSGTPGTALQPSTIDITAGPGFSGASGGGKSLHYSSTSYDARLGYQQNFQITVTDEGGVFSASRIRPRQQQQRCLNQVNICENQYDGNSGVENNSNNNNSVNSLYAEQQQNLQQQQQLYLLQHRQFHNNNVVALQQNIQNSINSPQGISGGGSSGEIGGKMCVPPQQALDGFTAEILQRQKKRRDKLAAALRENKKRLGQVEQEINLITGPIPSGLSERLDIEIQKLRTDCQAMLRSSNPVTQQSQLQEQQQQQQLAMNQIQQQQPQPFPRQRPARPPPRPPPPRQTSLEFIQHHSQTTTPYTPPAASLPNLNIYNTPSPILAHNPQQHSNSISPSFYHHQQQYQPVNITTEELYPDTDEEDYPDDGNDDDDYEVVEPWECNMCTFRNHPQLNICETCDNVRILPGTLPNLSRAISNSSANSVANTAAMVNSPTIGLLSVPSTANGATDNNTAASIVANGLSSSPNGNLEHDTNLSQQQLQHFALHT